MKSTLDIFRRGLVMVLAVVLMLGVTALATGGPVEEELPPVRDWKVRTYRNIPYRAAFLEADSQNGEISYSIVDQPKRGTVVVEGTEFIYTPNENQTGRDRFSYVAADPSGKVVQEGNVTIRIMKPKSGVAYSDMDGNPAAAAAQQLAEDGILVGVCMGDSYYFEPERTVSRSEFLAMAMEMAELPVTEVTMTGFCDDAAIPAWAKAYAASGLGEGVIQGTLTDEGVAFRGEEPVTVNQAAAILNRVLSVADVDLAVWYGNRGAVPSWAAQAVANMESVCVLSVGSFGSAALNEGLSRADAARMLCNASVLLHGEEGMLLSWLG